MDISTLENERRRAIQQQGDLRISGGWNLAREPNMEDSPYRVFKEDYDEWGFGVEDDGQGFFTPIPRIPFDERVQNPETNDMMIADGPRSPVKIYTDTDYYTGKEKKTVMPDFGATRINLDKVRFKPGFGPQDLVHHTEHFGDPGIEQLMKDKTLNDSDYERILGPDYKNKIQQYQQNQSMLISGGPFLKTVGDGNVITEDEYDASLKQIRKITNPLARQLAEQRLVDQYYLGLDPV
tara:strand:+ start:49 stop:759 length:711 start_codon:yes stop_codon:yes gene_type:complete